jgi:hypothetical protein
MKSRISTVIGTAFILLGSCAQAETQAVSVTGHFVSVDQGEVVTQPNGTSVRVGQLSHSTNVNDDTGEVVSQWCRANTVLDDSGAGVAGAGLCTQIYDDGAIAWVSFRNKAGQPGTWTSTGGTGRFEGQTGSGTTELVSNRGDGRAWTVKAQGTLTRP